MSEPHAPYGDPPKLRTDPARPPGHAVTHIYVRAWDALDRAVTCDIGELDRKSLHRWLRAKGGSNLFAENTVLVLLGHEAYLEEPDAR